MIDVKEFLFKIEKMKIISSNNGISDFCSKLFFKDNIMFSYNGEAFVITNSPICTDFMFSVSIFEFYNFLNKIKLKKIHFCVEKNHLLFKSKTIKAKLVLDKEININFSLDFLNQKNKKYKLLPSNFMDGVKKVKFCMSDDLCDSSGFITIMDNSMFTTDRYRVSKYILGSDIDDILLPKKYIDLLLRTEIDSYSITDKIYYFKNSIFTVGIAKLETNSFNFSIYDEFFSISDGFRIDALSRIKNNVEISEIFTDRNNFLSKSLNFIVRNKKITIFGNSNIGLIETTMELDIDNDLEFCIHPVYFLDGLEYFDSMIIDKKIVLFESENFKYIFKLD